MRTTAVPPRFNGLKPLNFVWVLTCAPANVKKTGTIQSLNVSPKGFYEGFLLKTGKDVVQVNLPKDQVHSVGDQWRLSVEIAVEVEPDEARGTAGHQVFKLVRVIGKDHGTPGDPDALAKFTGRIERLNYALHGEVNGGILDSGDFLHLKPEGARAVSLETGMAVKGKGRRKPMVGGHCVIEAEEVNGLVIEHHIAKKKHAQ
jgi:hypothetical protein